MAKPDWRDLVEACDDVYVYAADIYCAACGEDIAKRLSEAPGFDPENPPEDSDEFPQGPYSDGGGESDSPNHCGAHEDCLQAITLPCGNKIGCALAHELTNEGARSLNEMIVDDMLRPESNAHARQVGQLWAKLFSAYLVDDLFKISGKGSKLPTDLIELLMGVASGDRFLCPDFYLDPHGYIYGGAEGPQGDVLWRVEITPEGNYNDLIMIDLPAGELSQYPLEDHLKEAIDDVTFG
jgi:hypothetical protein